MDNMDFSNPDKQALALTHSIALAETGQNGKPDYTNTTGDNGTSKGAYQWQPGNFEAAAKNAGLDPNDFSPENQDKVAYSEIKSYKDKGYDPGQIASIWNSGSPNNWQNHSGTTTIKRKKISYDTPGYVKKVQKEYQKLSGYNPNPYSSGQVALDSSQPQAAQPTTDSGAPGNVVSDVKKGDYTGALESGVRNVGDFLTGGGTEQLGNAIGTNSAIAYNKIKGLLGGTDDSKYIKQADAGQAIAGGLKTAASVASLAGANSAYNGIKGLIGTPLDAPEIAYNIPMEMSDFSKLGTTEKLNVLGEALKTAEAGDAGKIAQAMKYLDPEKSVGIVSKLISKGMNTAKGYALYKIFGDSVGGLLHKMTGL